MDQHVTGLLNGKRPPEKYFTGEASEELAAALLERIERGVAPSLCAHAMCSSSAVGNVAVVRMLSKQPMSTFNKAYRFSEPLQRAARGYLRCTDPALKVNFRECAMLLVDAKANPFEPSKYLSSKKSVVQLLEEVGSVDCDAMLLDFKAIWESRSHSTDELSRMSPFREIKKEASTKDTTVSTASKEPGTSKKRSFNALKKETKKEVKTTSPPKSIKRLRNCEF